MRIVYGGLDVTFDGPMRLEVSQQLFPHVPPPVPPVAAPTETVSQDDRPDKIDIFGPEGENLMLTDPLAYEEMVERVLREKRV